MSWKRFCAAKKTDYGYVCRFAKLVVSVIARIFCTHHLIWLTVLAVRG